jgi:hypothetical protein
MMFELRMLGYRFLKAFMKPVVKLVPQPRPVVFVGPDAALRLCSMIGGFGFRRVLIVTDAVLVKIGVVAPLRCALVEQGIDVALFDSILPDPTHPVVKQGHAAALGHRSEAILAVGGGSSIDAAKVIGAPRHGNPPRGIRSERGKRFARCGRLRPSARVRSSVPVRKTRVTLGRMQVDVGIEGFVGFRSTRADLEDGRCARGSILQMMTIGGASSEGRAVAAPQQLFASIGYEHDLALEDVHKLVLFRVPVSLTRPGAWRQLEQIHSELREPGDIAEPTTKSFPAWLIEWRRIPRAPHARCLVYPDLVRHDFLA